MEFMHQHDSPSSPVLFLRLAIAAKFRTDCAAKLYPI